MTKMKWLRAELKKYTEIAPGHVIYQACLEQQVSVWQEFVTDEVLIVPHCHTMAHTQRAQHLQHLQHNMSALLNSKYTTTIIINATDSIRIKTSYVHFQKNRLLDFRL